MNIIQTFLIKFNLKIIGALTLKLNQFGYRPWELDSIQFFDLYDSFASFIRLEFKLNKLIRILPSLDNVFNYEFISDKSRFDLDIFKLDNIKFKSNLKYEFNISNLILVDFIDNLFISNQALLDFFNKLFINTKNFNLYINYIDFLINIYIIKTLSLINKNNFLDIDFSLSNKVPRFFFYITDLNKIYKNIYFYKKEDLNFKLFNLNFNIYNINYVNLIIIFSFFNNNFINFNFIFFFNNLNYLFDVLYFDIFYKYKLMLMINFNYKSLQINLINIQDINNLINSLSIFNLFDYSLKSNFNFEFYNILGINYIKNKYLKVFPYNFSFFNKLKNYIFKLKHEI